MLPGVSFKNDGSGKLGDVTYIEDTECLLEFEFPPLHLFLVVFCMEEEFPPFSVRMMFDLPFDLQNCANSASRRKWGSFRWAHSPIQLFNRLPYRST